MRVNNYEGGIEGKGVQHSSLVNHIYSFGWCPLTDKAECYQIYFQVMYEAGSNGAPLPPAYMNSLDCELVPVLHSGSLQGHLTLELVFHILDH